jgi:hypothetical protein
MNQGFRSYENIRQTADAIRMNFPCSLPSKAKGRAFQANRAFSGQSHLPPNVPMVMSFSRYVHVCGRPPQKRRRGITESCGWRDEKRRILSVIKKNPAASPEDAKRKDTPMSENRVISLGKRAEDEEKSFFEQLLQEGARKLLQAAIENEITDYIQFHKDRRDENGQRLVVRNGQYL